MDATKIKVGDKVRLRNGAVETVTELALTGEDAYPVEVLWGTAKIAYTVDGLECMHEQHDRDILEIIPISDWYWLMQTLTGDTTDGYPGLPGVGPKKAETSEETTDDIVVKPSHYTQLKFEPVTFVMENDPEGKFAKGNIIKYTCRAGSKLYPGQDAVQSEITDLEKARRYAEMRIRQLKGEEIL